MNELRVCKKCGIEKDIMDFRHQVRGEKTHISLVCKKCDSENSKESNLKFRIKNRDKKNANSREYYAKNKEKIKERQKDKKPIWDKRYYEKNKDKMRKIQMLRTKERYKTEPNFRIRRTISKSISRALKLIGHSKGGKSCLQFLPYTIQELNKHLESLFEPLMSWDNYGIYKKSQWKDNDPTTWTWQIDHIIPHSDLSYVSMVDENFQLAWSLDNLRPLSSKQNNIDGVLKIRHRRAKLL